MDHPVDTSFSSFPRLFATGPDSQDSTQIPLGFKPMADEFEAATGWVLTFTESAESQKIRKQLDPEHLPFGTVSISDMSSDWPAGKNTASRKRCDRLAERISDLLGQRQAKSNQLRQARLDLSRIEQAFQDCTDSFGEPETQYLQHGHPQAKQNRPACEQPGVNRLATTLASLLRSACELGHADQGAVYLVDEATENLVARCIEGPSEGIGQRRPLPSSIADVEALAGSVVVMKDEEAVKAWDCPVDCRSAVCLPIASSSQLLGTLWLFGEQETDYSDQVTNVLEIIAGRIAAELELDSIRGQGSEDLDLAGPTDLELEILESLEGIEEADLRLCGEWDPGSQDGVSGTDSASYVAPPFEGWAAHVRGGEQGIARWFVSSDEQLVAVVGTKLDEYQSLILDHMSKVCETSSELTASELAEALERLLECGSESGRSLVVALIDPLTGELEVAQIGDSQTLPVMLLDGREQSLIQLGERFRGFLSRSQSVVLGGEKFSFEDWSKSGYDLSGQLGTSSLGRAEKAEMGAQECLSRLVLSRS